MTARGRALLAVALFAALAATLGLASRSLSVPPVGSWGETSRWYESVGPSTAELAGVCMVAFAVALWLLAAALLQLAATMVTDGPLAAVARFVAPRSLERFVHGLVGVSFSATLVVTAPSAGLAPAAVPVSSGAHLGVGPPQGDGTATMRLVPDPALPPAQPVPAVRSVTVAPGDSLWSIAVQALIDAGQPRPSDASVTAYWRQLIDANRHVLVVPSNADLVYAGQVFTLPPT